MHNFIIAFLGSLLIVEILYYFLVTRKLLPDRPGNIYKSVLKNSLLNSLYPFSLLYIIFIPYLISLLYNFDNLNPHKILLLLIWIPIYSYLFYISGKKIFLFLIGIPLLIDGTIDILSLMTLGSVLTQENIFGIFQSNVSEVQGYFASNFSLDKIAVALLYWVAAFFFLSREKLIYPSRRKSVLISALFVIIVSIIAYKSTYAELEDVYPGVKSAAIRYSKEMSVIKKYLSKREFGYEIEAIPFNSSQKQLYVMIIGESTSRNHMSLYNYHRDTNPMLKSRNDIYIFEDVISAFSNTRQQLSSSLTLADYTNTDSFYKYPSVIDIARTAGFKTYWISNQDPIGFFDNQVTALSKTADETYFIKSTIQKEDVYDRAVIPIFENLLENEEERKFIIIHLDGTHMLYRLRYPPAFNVFTEYKSAKEKTINEYNNAILYNDYIVNSLLEKIEQYSHVNTISAALYFSDHGQEVYDQPNNYVGHSSQPTNRFQIEIPFVVWLSETFLQERPDDYDNIISALQLPYMIDDLNHSWLHLMGIESPLILKERSLFSEDYKPKRRIVYGQDYDLKLKNLN